MRTTLAAAVAVAAVAAVGLVACADDPDVRVCHFQSGRPCAADELCLGRQGDECNYYGCSVDGIAGTALGCQRGETPPVEGGPFNCDPSTVERPPLEAGAWTPPPAPCPLGSLYALDGSRASPYLFCVPVSQCAPIACDPQFNGDGCPIDHVCDAAARTCVLP